LLLRVTSIPSDPFIVFHSKVLDRIDFGLETTWLIISIEKIIFLYFHSTFLIVQTSVFDMNKILNRIGGEYKMASFEIGARGLFNFRNERFFLLVEDEITIPEKGVEIDPVNIYEIDQQTFNFIRDEGDTPIVVPRFNLPPVPPGFELERKCIFTVDNSYFIIYELENGTDNFVMLRISAALFNSLRNSGVRECVPQDFIN